MVNLKRVLVFFLLSLIYIPYTKATHIIGGEISYRALGGNQYEFIVKIYRDCYLGTTELDNPAYFTIFNASNTVVLNPSVYLVSDTIIPAKSDNPCLIVPPNLCVEEGTYIFQATLPPSSGGYVIAYQRCCRNNSIVNLSNPGNTGATYVATLNDEDLLVANNSPMFKRYPPIVICYNQPLVFDHSAMEADGDSLVYELCSPYLGATFFSPMPTTASNPPYSNVNFQSPYTYLNPMDGSPALSINPKTGLLTITPTALGQFVVGVCVKEYRNGVYLGNHLRDFQFNVVNCEQTVTASIPGIINNCSAYDIQFQNFSIGGTKYHWDFGVPGVTNDTSNLQFPSFTFPDTGVYTVTLTVNPGSACSDSASSKVFVYPSLKANLIAPNGCKDKPIKFSDKTTVNVGYLSNWNWNFGDNSSPSDLQNPFHTYSNAGNYTVTLIVETNHGCRDTVSQSIVVSPAPTVTIFPHDTIICTLDNLPLISTVQGATSYQWTPDYNISSSTVQNPTVSPKATTTYQVIVSNSYGCTASDSVTVKVFDVLADAGIDHTICPGQNAQLSGTGGAHFIWTPPTGLSNPNIANPVANPVTTTTYTLTVSAGSCSDSDVAVVTVKTFPSLIVGPDQSICKGDTAALNASGCTTYNWMPSATVKSPAEPNTVAYPNQTTTYYVSATDSNKCPLTLKDSIVVNVFPAGVTGIMGDTTIVYGTSGQLFAYGGASYSWYPAEGLDNPTIASPMASPTATTTYYVEMITHNGCKVIDSIILTIVYEPIVKFPNAFSPNGDGKNDFFRPMVAGLLSDVHFRIYNRWGQLIYESNDATLKGWDGTFKGIPQETGVYVYVFECIATVTGADNKMKGNVSLLR